MSNSRDLLQIIYIIFRYAYACNASHIVPTFLEHTAADLQKQHKDLSTTLYLPLTQRFRSWNASDEIKKRIFKVPGLYSQYRSLIEFF